MKPEDEDAAQKVSAESGSHEEKSETKTDLIDTQSQAQNQDEEITSVLYHIVTFARSSVFSSHLWEIYSFLEALFSPFTPSAAASLYHQCCMNATTCFYYLIDWVVGHGHLAMLIVQSFSTIFAALWLLFRTYKTLRTPVKTLINILGVEVPDAPEVTLAGLKSNAITLHWSAPVPSTKGSVVKYLIQVNGVNVGESSRSETAIEVTGLKPGHFYNVRVIAVAANHFQAGSRVLRLSTLRKDGRPYQGHSGSLSDRVGDDDDGDGSESDDDAQPGHGHGVGIQAATLPEPVQIPMVREHSAGVSGVGNQAGQRRNTGGRKHSPSTAAADQAARERAIAKLPEESMHQLTEKFEQSRKDTEETAAMIAKELEEFKSQYLELSKERDGQKQTLKDKEEQSEKIKKDANAAERLNRLAQNKKSQREKVLKDKKAEREKMRDDMARWKDEIETMRKEKENWRIEKAKLGIAKDVEVAEIQKQIADQQLFLEGLEKDIQVRGRQIRDLEAERMKLPGSANAEDSQAQDDLDKEEEAQWQAVEMSLVSRLNSSSQRLRDIEIILTQSRSQLSALQAAHQAAHQATQPPPMILHGDSSGVDFDSTGGQGRAKPRRNRNRRSRTSTISSPTSAYPNMDSPFSNAYNNPGNTPSPAFAPPPFMQRDNDTGMVIQADHMSSMSDEDIRHFTAGAPLSPTATSLLPSKLLLDDDQDGQDERAPPFGHAMYGNFGESFDKDPQSPESSSRSASLINSPHNSLQNLALYGVSSHDHPNDGERRSVKSPLSGFGTTGSPATAPAVQKGSIMSLFGLPKMRSKTIQEDGPALGSLKHGQSQSFPRSSEDPETANPIKHRRISLSTPNWGSILKGFSPASTSTQGNAPAPARPVRARNHRGYPFSSNSVDEPYHSERDLSSPRPISISSSDFPRPSTDSAPFGWGPAPEINRNSPLAANWSVNPPAPQPWSRNPSRRPSIQHGSSSALAADSAPDDYDDFAGQASPPPVGVIGTRPASSHKPPTPRLNPAAPAYKGKGKAVEIPTSPDDFMPHDTSGSSPAASRKSRDAHSIRTQNSMAESHESLDRAVSNTTSEFPSGSSAKEKDGSALRQLLRKGSSTKFNFSAFRGKKPVSSTANSERDNSLDEFGEDGGHGRSVDSITSSPMIGSIGSGEWKGKDKEAGTPKEGRTSVGWGRFSLKKGKGRESSDVDRSEAEVTGDEA